MNLYKRIAGVRGWSSPLVFKALTVKTRAFRTRAFKTLAFKLYAILVIAVTSIIGLVFVGSYSARMTASAALHLSEDGLHGIVRASELDVLIEKHRRLVEAAPAEADRRQIARSRAALADIDTAVRSQIARKTDQLAQSISRQMNELRQRAERVLMLAENFSWDAATDAVDHYITTADSIQATVRRIRARQQSAATDMVGQLLASAESLIRWGTITMLIALLVLAPMGLLVLGDGARRLKALWWAMFRIAQNDIHEPVPFLRDADEIGHMARAVQIFKDNAVALADKRSEIEQVNRFLDIALNNMARGLSMFDADDRLVICNAIYRDIYELPAHLAIPGTSWDDIALHRSDMVAKVESDIEKTVTSLTDLRSVAARGDATIAHQSLKDGRIISVAIQPLDDGGWVAVHEDVTRQRQADTKIARLARYDTMTGLANRHTLREEIDARCKTDSSRSFALLLIDLDKFKQVNDTFGHPTGDALLTAVSERLQKLTRATDLVARLGGDEFAVLQDAAVTGDAAAVLAARLIDHLSEPYFIEGQRVLIGASIGIATFPEQGTTMSDLLGHADVALYEAKSSGRGAAVIFDHTMKEAIIAERTLEDDLKRALAEAQFELFYQPILHLQTGRTIACEALLRWRHPQRGLIPPLDFIPFAEQSGLIVPIGRWALRRACQDALSWPDHIGVAVNLSAAQVVAGDLIEVLDEVLTETGLAPNRLELEVTETLLLDDEMATRETLLGIRERGVRIALDDFGTGYASLGYLRRFPFDKLKIDQEFVRDITDQHASTAIVRAVASMAKSLDMTAVAEGVETVAHLARVAAAGCTEVQGYLFSKPVPASEIRSVIETCSVPPFEHNVWLQQAV